MLRAVFESMVGATVGSRPRDPFFALLQAAVPEFQAGGAAPGLRVLVVGGQPEAEIVEVTFSSVMIAHTGPRVVGPA